MQAWNNSGFNHSQCETVTQEILIANGLSLVTRAQGMPTLDIAVRCTVAHRAANCRPTPTAN